MYYKLSSFYDNLLKLGKNERIQFLKTCISTSSDISLRRISLKMLSIYFEQVEGFNYFKNIFLSDEEPEMRIRAGFILRRHYLRHKELPSLFFYMLRSSQNLKLKIFALKNLYKMNNYESKSLILEHIKKIDKKLPDKNNEKIKEIINKLNPNFILSNTFKNIFLNLLIYDFYTNENQFHVIVREGYVFLLNCEGSGLNTIRSLVGLSSLKRLEYLNLQRNSIRNMRGLSELKGLKSLDLSYNEIDIIEYIEKLPHLEEVLLSNNNIRNIGCFPKLPNLKKLYLNGNNIKKIQGLTNLSFLKDLNLGDNAITKMEGLGNLKNLKKLNLSFNKISKIEGLIHLKSLIWLHLNDNQIQVIEGIDTLVNLKTFYLSNNTIESIQNLDHLGNLIKLEISKNKIHKIKGLDRLVRLQELYLDDNFIETFEGISKLESLIILFLNRNKIIEFNEDLLKGLKNLNFIFLSENPLNAESRNRYLKRTRFP